MQFKVNKIAKENMAQNNQYNDSKPKKITQR